MLFLGANFSGFAQGDLVVARDAFATSYTDWPSAAAWLGQVETPHLAAAGDPGLSTPAVLRAADELGERFGAFNDGECKSLKRTLLEMEDARAPGRVRLADFYSKGLHSHWNFDEKPEKPDFYSKGLHSHWNFD